MDYDQDFVPLTEQPDPDDEPRLAEPQTEADGEGEWVELALYEEAVAERDRYLRAVADAETRSRRAAEQARVGVQRANEQFLEGLLPVLAGFDRALDAARGETSLDNLVQGLELLGRQLGSFLDGIGAEYVPAEVGDVFDPELHEAMMRVPASEQVPEGQIAFVMERGIKLNGRVVRPARVAVAAPSLDAEA